MSLYWSQPLEDGINGHHEVEDGMKKGRGLRPDQSRPYQFCCIGAKRNGAIKTLSTNRVLNIWWRARGSVCEWSSLPVFCTSDYWPVLCWCRHNPRGDRGQFLPIVTLKYSYHFFFKGFEGLCQIPAIHSNGNISVRVCIVGLILYFQLALFFLLLIQLFVEFSDIFQVKLY